MKNVKLPGIDGSTVEFYKKNWNGINIPIHNYLSESIEVKG